MSNLNYNRKQSGGYLKRHLPLDVNCLTTDSKFSASLFNLNLTGAFLKTDKNLSVGQEIAMTIRFPNNDDTIKATGQIVRANYSGVEVEFKIFFNK
jgi:Tfp pilus assembly protein PilZ